MRSRLLVPALAAALGIATLLSVSSPTEAAPPDARLFDMFGLQQVGSGCPDPQSLSYLTTETTDPVTGEIATELSVTYSSLVAWTDPSVVQRSKRCQVDFGVAAPAGFSYALASVDHRGTVTLDPNVVAQATARYYVTGDPTDVARRTTLIGADDGSTIGPWTRHDLARPEELVWSRCGMDSISHIIESVSVSNTAAVMGVSPGQAYGTDPSTLDALYSPEGLQLLAYKDASGNVYYADHGPSKAAVRKPALARIPWAEGVMGGMTVVYTFKWKRC